MKRFERSWCQTATDAPSGPAMHDIMIFGNNNAFLSPRR